jgi:hypothetical protein
MFRNCQLRSFDFKDKPNSRYMLLETMKTPAVALFANETPGAVGGGVAPAYQYVGVAGGLVHAINKTTFNVTTSFDAQVDLALKLGYQHCGWEFDIGYDLWARTCEKICVRGDGFPANTYALKGDAYIYGYTGISPIALSATESLADIHAGTNTPIGTTFARVQLQNPGIDTPRFAQTTGNVVLTGPGLSTLEQTRTSLTPVLLSDADVDYRGVPRALTNRIFANLSYSWTGCDNWTPFFGIGGSGEFANGCGDRGNCGTTTGTTTTVGSCDGNRSGNGCALSQWAVWLKTGVAY